MITRELAGGATLPINTRTEPGVEYEIVTAAAADYAGNRIPTSRATFTTSAAGVIDKEKPRVTTNVANSAENVPIDIQIIADFSEPVRIVTASLETFYTSIPTPQKYQLSADRRRLTLNPTRPLLRNFGYWFYLVGSDDSGNPIEGLRDDQGRNSVYFQTGVEPFSNDTTPPVIVAVSPPDGAMGVRAPQVEVTFSEPMHGKTLLRGAVWIVPDYAGRFGFLRVSQDGTVAKYHIDASGSPGNEIALGLTSTVTDLAGNALEPVILRFRLAEREDSEPQDGPEVLGSRPENAASGVDPDQLLYLFLANPVDPATVPAAVRVTVNGNLVGGSVTTSAGDQFVSWRPSAPFPLGAQVHALIDQRILRSPRGTPGGGFEASRRFSIRSDPAQAPPQVLLVDPAGSRAPPNAHFTVRFSESIDASTINAETISLSVEGEALPFQTRVEDDGQLVRIIPEQPLPADRSVRLLYRSGIRDLSGEGLVNTFSRVIQAILPEILTTPQVTHISPPPGAAGVGVNARIEARFSEPINPLSVIRSSVRWEGGAEVEIACSFESAANSVMVIPHIPFMPLTTYTITLRGITDSAGHVVPEFVSTFTTGAGADFTRPTVLTADPSGEEAALNSVIAVRFSEPMDPVSADAAAFNLWFGRVEVSGSRSLSSDGRTAFLFPDELLEPNQEYIIGVGFGLATRNAQDLSGNPLMVGSGFSFVTGRTVDERPPREVRSMPMKGAVGVAPNTRVVIVFDQAIRMGSLDSGAVELSSGGVATPIEKILDPTGRYLTLLPRVVLNPSSEYYWSVAGLLDTAGDALKMPVAGSFRTSREVDILDPDLVSTSPPYNAVGVDPSTLIHFTFSEPIDPSKIRASTSANNIAPDRFFSLDGRTVTVRPKADLPASQFVSVNIVGIADLAGNDAQSVASVQFRTGDSGRLTPARSRATAGRRLP